MYDKERMGKLISDIERYFADLEGLDVKTAKDLEDKKIFYSVSMLFFSLINRVIDLGEDVVSANNFGTPGTYKNIFSLLYRGGVINSSMRKQLSELSSYRNLFFHEYYAFTEKDVFAAHEKIGIVRDFVKKVKKKLQQRRNDA